MSGDALGQLVDNAEGFLAERPSVPTKVNTSSSTALLSISDVDNMVSSGLMTHPMMAMAKDGQRLPAARYTWGSLPSEPEHQNAIRPELVSQEIGRGATVTNRKVGDFAACYLADLGSFVSASSYLTPSRGQGLSHHFDVHDAFILQTAGSKRWELIEPIISRPLQHHYFQGVLGHDGLQQRLRESPDFTMTLEEGEVMFLPRGWIHNCLATSQDSLHVTFAIISKTKYWALRGILEKAVETDWIRADLPYSSSGLAIDGDTIVPICSQFREWVIENSEELRLALGGSLLEGVSGPAVDAISTGLSLPLDAAWCAWKETTR